MTDDPKRSGRARVSFTSRFPYLAVGHWSSGIFLLASALYFLTRSPALDEWDSVQFAMGATRGFNLFAHQPHPPGYPLYVFAGWVGTRIGLDVLTALEAAAALGGGLFVASWFGLARRATGGDLRLAGWFAVALTVLPITWLTATKALSDAPAAGLLALELLGASVYRERRTWGALTWTALAGAAAAGMRPQNVAVAGLILGLSLMGSGAAPRARAVRWASGFGLFLAGCLVWLVPTMLLQSRWPEAGGSVWAYPAQLWHQWTWRLDQPKAFVGASGQTGEALLRRVWLHFGGMISRGFAPTEDIAVGVLVLTGMLAGWWIAFRRRAGLLTPFLRENAAWAGVYTLIIFLCLPPDQRYYLPIFPLLLLPPMLGLAGSGNGFRRCLLPLFPVALLVLTWPLVWKGHTRAAPPVRLVRWLNDRYPNLESRERVWLIFHDTRRHAEWYGPGFRIEWAEYFPAPINWPADWPEAVDIYTDAPRVVALPLPEPGRAWVPVGEWHRSPLIYRKHNAVTLWRLSKTPG